MYASLCESVRNGNKVTKGKSVYIGRLLDRERMIFKNKKDGVFQYDLETNTKKPVPADFEHAAYRGKAREASYSLAFGDSFLFLYCMKSAGFIGFLENLGFGDIAGIKALLTFIVVSRPVNFHPQDWLKDNFARLLYPKADLTSKGIGDLLAAIGGEPCLRRFSCEYLSFLRASDRSLVSFGLQSNEGGKKYKTKPCSNSEGERAVFMKAADWSDGIRFPSSGDAEGNVRKEDDARLVCVVQRKTGLPLYMEYVSGAKIDAASMFAVLRNQKCRVYPDVVIPDEARRVQYEYYERFGVKVPQTISLSSGQVPERESGCGRHCTDESVQAAG